MRILYFTDDYANGVMGTKRSLSEEMQRRGHEVLTVDKDLVGKLPSFVHQMKPDQVWLAHSGLVAPCAVDVPVIGFGFSDPYYFTPGRLEHLDAYVTNHKETAEKYADQLPIHYNPTACDPNFHHRATKTKDIDVSLVGVADHPRFKSGSLRREYAEAIKPTCYGLGWENPHIEGAEFLDVLQRSKIGLDIQEDWSPIAHRMMEYAACGSMVITRERREVWELFKGGEVVTYVNLHDLQRKLRFYLTNDQEREAVANAGYSRVTGDHTISKRVDSLSKFVEQFAGVLA